MRNKNDNGALGLVHGEAIVALHIFVMMVNYRHCELCCEEKLMMNNY